MTARDFEIKDCRRSQTAATAPALRFIGSFSSLLGLGKACIHLIKALLQASFGQVEHLI